MAKVLLVHGAPGDARLWAPVIDAMDARFDCHAITLSYFGVDDWPGDGSDFGTTLHKEDIVALAEEIGGPLSLVAWSFGCHPALLAAIERPDLFAQVALYEPSLDSYVDDADERADFAADTQAAFGPVFAALQDGDTDAALELIFDNAAQQGAYARLPEARRAIYRDSMRALPLLMGGGKPPVAITSDDLAGIGCPVTVALGEHTRPMFAIPSRAVAKAIAGVCLREVPDATHMLPETDPQRFAALLSEWLG